MKTLFKADNAAARMLIALGPLLLTMTNPCPATEPDKSAAVPPRSLVLRGPSTPAKAALSSPTTGTNTPEHGFGLNVELVMRTNGYSVITRAFDVDAFYRRFVPTLPTSSEIKEKLFAAPHKNGALLKQILHEAVSDITGTHIRFLGVRSLGREAALLFRQMDIPGLDVPGVHGTQFIGNPVYIAYITERQSDGSIRLIDVQRFAHGEMLSQTMRRRTLLELAGKGLLGDQLSAGDRARISGKESLELFESRRAYGRFHLIKDAYERLAPELQEDRAVLYAYANTGDRSIDDVLIPVERWRRLYPGDPTSDLMVVNFYWILYQGPRYVAEGPAKGTHFYAALSPRDEEAITAAIQRANVWFADPAMEIRLARYYGTEQPAKARPLLQQALQRFPSEPSALAELLKVDLAAANFTGVAETLHLQEVALQTNLTEMVNSSNEYATFRKSFPWKKWQHDYHEADVKALTDASGRLGR